MGPRSRAVALVGCAALGFVSVLRIPTSAAVFTRSTTNGSDSFASGSLLAPDPPSCAWTGANSLSFGWTSTSALADGYQAERSNSAGSGYAALATVVGVASVSTTDANPSPPTLRYYRVRSYAGSGWTSAYGTVTASNTCDGTILTAVTAGTVTDPTGVAVDSSGNVFTSSGSGNAIFKTTPAGVTTTYAGNGTAGYSGDGGAASAAKLNTPKSVAIDGSNNLYFVDNGNDVVRKITSGGTISTVAGNGLAGYSGDNGAAISARLNNPFGVSVDGSGNLYIADTGNNVIRKVSGGTITTIAGTGVAGYTGDGGSPTSAQLNFPYYALADGTGKVYISDFNNSVVRRISGGLITTIAGAGVNTACSFSGSASSAGFDQPKRMAYDSATGRIFIPDAGQNCVRVLNGTNIGPAVGTGTNSSTGDNGPAIAATVGGPTAVAWSAAGDLYVADSTGPSTRRVLQP